MKNKFLGIICLLYSSIITYLWITDSLKNFLAPNMQLYLKISLFLIFIMGIILLIGNDNSYKFKISDLVLVLPIILLLTSGDFRLTTSLASNKISKYNKKEVVEVEESSEQEIIYIVILRVIYHHHLKLINLLEKLSE